MLVIVIQVKKPSRVKPIIYKLPGIKKYRPDAKHLLTRGLMMNSWMNLPLWAVLVPRTAQVIVLVMHGQRPVEDEMPTVHLAPVLTKARPLAPPN
jgi:hypothetical protein